MKAKTNKSYPEYIYQVSEKLDIDPRELNLLRRQAITLRNLYECQCNGCIRDRLAWESWAEYDRARESQMEWIDNRVIKVLRTIDKKCAKLNLHYHIQTDPRGPALYISRSEISPDNYHVTAEALY